MKTHQKNALAMLRRVREILSTEPVAPALAIPLAQLDGTIARLSEHAVNQDALTRRIRSLTRTIAEQGRFIRQDRMRLAVRAARTLFPNDGGAGTAIRVAMRLPRSATDMQQQVLAAQGMATVIDEHAEQFASAGIPKEHAASLRGAAEALVSLINERSTEEQRRVAATQGIAAEEQRGRALVSLLDAMVRPTVRTDPARAAEWQKAIRTMRRPAPPPVSPDEEEVQEAA